VLVRYYKQLLAYVAKDANAFIITDNQDASSTAGTDTIGDITSAGTFTAYVIEALTSYS